MIETRV